MTFCNVACIQMNSSDDMEANLAEAGEAIEAATRQGAELIALPEAFAIMEASPDGLLTHSHLEAKHPALSFLRQCAAQHNIWLIAGTIPVLEQGEVLPRNRCYLLNAGGEIIARYDKIHPFDIDLPNGKKIRESDRYTAGDTAVLAPTPWGELGMSICYDLRFPQLYRQLAQAGASILCVPSAFTSTTGEAHWHSLLRARAIETSSYVIAPAQTGHHPGERKTYGHSLIIDPWGKVLADAGTEKGTIFARLDMKYVQECRQRIPSWTTDKKWGMQKIS